MNAMTTITESRLATLAPSVFATEAHSSRSARYGYVNSIDLIRALVDRGFEISAARQANTRNADKTNHTKHIVRLRHAASFARVQQAIIEGRAMGDTHTAESRALARSPANTYGEVVLTNSHDGSSAVILHGGALRLDCFNGLFIADSCIASIHVTHSARLVANVIDGAFAVAEQLPKALAVAADWGGIQLEHAEAMALAKAAHVLRFADDEGKVATAVTPERLLDARRTVDQGKDLWTTFNRVQENVVRGGLRDVRPVTEAQRQAGQWRARQMQTRPIKGIDQDVRLNKALWTLAQELAKAKAA